MLMRDHQSELMLTTRRYRRLRMLQTIRQNTSCQELIIQYHQWFLHINNLFIMRCQWWIWWCHHIILLHINFIILLPTAIVTVPLLPRELVMDHHLRFGIQLQMYIQLIRNSRNISCHTRWCITIHSRINSIIWCNKISRSSKNKISSNSSFNNSHTRWCSNISNSLPQWI